MRKSTPGGTAGQGSAFLYLADSRYFAQCGREMEGLVEDELLELGAREPERARGGVHFRSDRAGLYRIVYGVRLASRILAPLAAFPCRSESDLYESGMRIEWERLLDAERTFAVAGQVSASAVRHSQYAALKLKDAIADRFRRLCGRRPSVDREQPDLAIQLNIHADRAVVSLDASGLPLHRRGYRIHGGEAPLQETMAAAVIRLSGWTGDRPLYDPLCGSGTLLAEALMRHCRLPAGFLRQRFGFQGFPDFDPRLWQRIRSQADSGRRPLAAGLISGSDIDAKVVRAAKDNLSRLPEGRSLALSAADFRSLPGLENRLIAANLPYGVRVGDRAALPQFYKEFGDFLKRRCRGSSAWLLCGDLELIGKIGLKPARRIPLWNGPIECRLLHFELY